MRVPAFPALLYPLGRSIFRAFNRRRESNFSIRYTLYLIRSRLFFTIRKVQMNLVNNADKTRESSRVS